MSQIVENPAAAAACASGASYVTPAVNIHRNAEGYTLEVELPGVARDGVEVTFADGRLTLVGRRSRGESAEHPVYRESSEGDYRRVFELDSSVDASRIEATVEQGLLTLRLPKAESAKPRRIAVA